MKNLILALVALATMALASSCSVSNEVHFNKNYSGEYAMHVDFGEMIEMAKQFDPSMEEQFEGGLFEDPEIEAQRQTMVEQINALEGISNTKIEVKDETMLSFTFDFDDVDALNHAFTDLQSAMGEGDSGMPGGMGGLGDMNMPSFTRDGKTISHGASVPDGSMDSLGLDDESMGMVDMMTGMMDYTIQMTFDRKIKEVNVDGVDLLMQDKKMVKTRLDVAKLTSGGGYNIEVKLK